MITEKEFIPNKVRNKLGIIPSVKTETRAKKDTLHIEINPSSVPISYDGKYYIRSGSTTLELKDNELANFIMKKLGKTWDEFVEERVSLEDINPVTLKNGAVD